ncbi:MAG: ABC transporter permease [Verrucomicrobia bacterium]|nr:ABC transporter permease [Verrucomicrobiota bacterium]
MNLNSIITITRREFVTLITSPLASVFLVIFLFGAGLMTFQFGRFFDGGEASLATFFSFHPWLYLFLVPAIGMNLWAEEKRSGTIELLLTFPIASWHAIAAKFLATWIFIALALAFTLPYVFMVQGLGDPDMGPILTGYLGSFLMAGTYLAITCFTSALTRNPIISFIIAFVVCFILILCGFPPITEFLSNDLNLAGWIVRLVSGFSFMTHFEMMQRGLVLIRDVVFFISTIGFFLFATSFVIRSQRAG